MGSRLVLLNNRNFEMFHVAHKITGIHIFIDSLITTSNSSFEDVPWEVHFFKWVENEEFNHLNRVKSLLLLYLSDTNQNCLIAKKKMVNVLLYSDTAQIKIASMLMMTVSTTAEKII